jgi:hypothetical protein
LQRLHNGLTRLNLTTGKLPMMGKILMRLTLRQQHPTQGISDNRNNHINHNKSYIISNE